MEQDPRIQELFERLERGEIDRGEFDRELDRIKSSYVESARQQVSGADHPESAREQTVKRAVKKARRLK